jgi:hypothetical protein
LRRIDHDDDHAVAPRGQFPRRRAACGANGDGFVFALGVDVAHGDRPAQFAQARRHREAHVADADDADVHVCTSRRLLEIDISIPSPRPSVTIAVPP